MQERQLAGAGTPDHDFPAAGPDGLTALKALHVKGADGLRS